jgi:hypothetical protein
MMRDIFPKIEINNDAGQYISAENIIPKYMDLWPYQTNFSGYTQPASDKIQVHEMPKKGI